MINSLLQPYELGGMTLPNRIVMAPVSRHRADARTHEPTAPVATYYEQRASAGLLISEGIAIGPLAHCGIRLPGLYTEGQIRGWREVTDRVHAAGGRIVAQILHAGRLSHPSLIGGAWPVGPSAIDPEHAVVTTEGPHPAPVPHAMSVADIRKTVDDFGRTADNAIQAGFDGVEVHGANGYLIHQFLSASANQRTDAYGGSREGRAQFLFEILDAVIERVGASRTGLRLSPNVNRYAGIHQDAETPSDYEALLRRVNPYRPAFLHLCGHVIGEADAGEELTRDTARRFRPHFEGPLILNHSLSRNGADSAISEGSADLASFGRPFIANPDLVERFRDDIALSAFDSATLFEGGDRGYIDYPAAAVPSLAL